MIFKINEKIFRMASAETNYHGTGGMFTKIEAAEIASESGCDTIICRGTKKNPIIFGFPQEILDFWMKKDI